MASSTFVIGCTWILVEISSRTLVVKTQSVIYGHVVTLLRRCKLGCYEVGIGEGDAGVRKTQIFDGLARQQQIRGQFI